MAECSYARCLQERRFIKRELLKWTKDMVYIVGLERVAEELMGRRKWKLYQEILARSQLNLNSSPNLSQRETSDQNNRLELLAQQQQSKENSVLQQPALVVNHLKENEVVTIKSEISENTDTKVCSTPETGNIGDRLQSEDSVDNLENSVSRIENSKEPPPYPIDWKPAEKCYYCVDGKLLTVNEKGELVAESGPASSEAELAHRASLDSDSDSSDSSPEIEVQNSTAINANKSVTSLLRDSLPPNMTSFESMAAHLAAVASLQGLPSGLAPFYPSLWYHQLAQVPPATTTTSEAAAAAISPPIKDSPSPSDVTGEQPLDLSAKPSPNCSISAGGDPKQVFRAKPRMSAAPGRRTYTEEELHSALQDIISGKLGTRRAAVLYGIPRSTLRNKVYKIAMEQKREASALHQPVLEALVDQDDEDKELSGDDEKDEKLLASSLGAQTDELTQYATSHLTAAALHKISKACENHQQDIKPAISLETQQKLPSTTPQPHTPPITPNPWLDPNVLLQSLLLAGQLGGVPGLMQPKPDDPAAIQDLLKNLFIQHQELVKEQIKNSATNDLLNNGKPNITDPRILMQNLTSHHQQHQSHHQQQQQNQQQTHQQQSQQSHQQQQQQHQQQQQQQHQHATHHYQNRLMKSETPETASSTDLNEISDDPSVILKIPSYKPVAGSSTSGKNGESLSSPLPAQQTTPPIMSRSPQQPNSLPEISPPLIRQSSESQSPPIPSGKSILSLRDVIANSISRTFNQQAKDVANAKLEQIDPYKRASISVIKNIGGTDISRFATTPNMLGNNSSSSSQNASSGSSGGKGTRPKRGKYRNYDRDSLVEAVKAVQRGEMSVHRAGSYYGVPHSTLEYKVKERHLMRPRKREPKPQPLDDRTGSSSISLTNSKNTNIPSLAAVSGLDKNKSTSSVQKPVGSKNQPFPSTSPNGMKVPIFDPAMAAQLQYTSHLFWPHSPGFGALPIDFARGPPSAATGGTPFGSNAESFLASQMMQRFHEDSNRLSGGNSSINTTANATTPIPVSNNNKPPPNNTSASTKSARELAESLYDGAGANGSFLDGIIRQTLDRKPGDIPHGALLDQLVRNTRTPSLSSPSDDQIRVAKPKRSGSPMHFPGIDIKRERSSPPTATSSDADRNSIERDISKESVESLLKMRDGLTLKMEDKAQSQLHHHHHHTSLHQQHQPATSNLRHLSIEDLNGRGGGDGGGRLHDKLGQIKSEPEDSL